MAGLAQDLIRFLHIFLFSLSKLNSLRFSFLTVMLLWLVIHHLVIYWKIIYGWTIVKLLIFFFTLRSFFKFLVSQFVQFLRIHSEKTESKIPLNRCFSLPCGSRSAKIRIFTFHLEQKEELLWSCAMTESVTFSWSVVAMTRTSSSSLNILSQLFLFFFFLLLFNFKFIIHFSFVKDKRIDFWNEVNIN